MRRSIVSLAMTILAAMAVAAAAGTTANADTTTLYAQLSAAAEVPAANSADASGTGLATISLNTQTDYYGNIIGASATFDVTLSGFPNNDQITMAHIHIGASGSAGAVVVDTMAGTQSFSGGSATLHFADVSVSASIAQQIMDGPDGFYFNVHTMMSPNGAVRGQLTTQKPTPQTSQQETDFSAQLSPANEVPPITNADSTGSGQVKVALTVTTDDMGNVTGASAEFDITVTGFPATDHIVAAHIHSGAAGISGAVVVDTGISSMPLTGGGGTFTLKNVAVSTDIAQQILANPSAFYFNIHTDLNQGGAARGQLQLSQSTETDVLYGAVLSSANEVPAVTGPEASAKGQGNFLLHVVKDGSGNITGATADFNFSITGLPSDDKVILTHVHTGARGAAGAVVVDSGLVPANSVSAVNGVWSFSSTGVTVSTDLAQQIMSNPAAFYFNVHTTMNPTGAMRGQLEAVPTLTSATLQGTKLLLSGAGFVKGDAILINGQPVAKTKFTSSSQLLGKKATKMIASGQTVMIQVQQADGLVSAAISFKRD